MVRMLRRRSNPKLEYMYLDSVGGSDGAFDASVSSGETNDDDGTDASPPPPRRYYVNNGTDSLHDSKNRGLALLGVGGRRHRRANGRNAGMTSTPTTGLSPKLGACICGMLGVATLVYLGSGGGSGGGGGGDNRQKPPPPPLPPSHGINHKLEAYYASSKSAGGMLLDEGQDRPVHLRSNKKKKKHAGAGPANNAISAQRPRGERPVLYDADELGGGRNSGTNHGGGGFWGSLFRRRRGGGVDKNAAAGGGSSLTFFGPHLVEMKREDKEAAAALGGPGGESSAPAAAGQGEMPLDPPQQQEQQQQQQQELEQQPPTEAEAAAAMIPHEEEPPMQQQEVQEQPPPQPATELPPLPEVFRNLASITDPPNPTIDVPLFWHMSGGGVGHIIRNAVSCRHSVLASSEGGSTTEGHDAEPELRVVSIDGKSGQFVNVDTTTVEGLRRAKNLGLGSARFDDRELVIMTPLLHPALDMFDGSDRRGRAFAFFRHPVQRAVSTYLNLKNGGEAAFASMTLEDYARSEYVESNWMTRSLTGTMDGELNSDMLEIAKELLRTKFVVGLLDDKYGSMGRFERYFGWEYRGEEEVQCREEALGGGDEFEQSARQIVQDGGEAVDLLVKLNDVDWQLFEFVDTLYREQGGLFPDLPAAAATEVEVPPGEE